MEGVTIRYAQTGDDAVMIATLGCNMHAESNFKDMPYDIFDVKAFADWVIQDESQAAILAETAEGDLVGMVLCGANRSFYGPAVAAYEHAFYVAPGWRKSGLAVALRDAYLAWAASKGARRVAAGNSAGAPDENFVKLWQDAGAQRAGSLMYLYL